MLSRVAIRPFVPLYSVLPRAAWVAHPFLGSELLAKIESTWLFPWVERKNSAASSVSFAGEEDVAFGLGVGFDGG